MKISLFTLLLLTSFICLGQKPALLIETSEKFMGQESILPVFDIETDNKGYVYSTTAAYINRFDGYSNESLKKNIMASMVVALYKDYFGQIWFSRMDGGIGYIKEDKIIDFPLPDNLKKLGRTGYENIYRDSSGVIHVAPKNYGYFKVENGKINSVKDDSNLFGYIVTQLDDGHWFHYSTIVDTSDYSVYYQDNAGEKQFLCQILENRSYYQSALVEHTDGSVSLSIGDHSIFRIQEGKLIDNHQFKHLIIKLFVDSKNNLWIGTLDHGFFKAENSDLSQLEHLFVTGAASVLAEGKDGSIWFNSDSLKVGRIPSLSMRYYNRQNNYPMFSSIRGIETYGDSIIVQNRKRQLFVLYNDHVTPLTPPIVEHIEGTDRDFDLPGIFRYDPFKKELWISYFGLLRTWDGNQWNSIHFSHSLFKLPRTKDMKILKNGQVFGTTPREVYEVKNNEVIPISELSTSEIRKIEVLPSGQIWVSRDDGIWVLEEGKFKRPSGDLPEIFYDSSNGIVEALGRVWIYNLSGGLYSIENNQSKLESIDQHSGMAFGAHFVAANGDLWLFSELHQTILLIKKMDAKITIEQFQFDNFVESGFQGRLLLVREKEIYLSTMEGLLVQKIDQLKKGKMMVNVAISEIRVNHKLAQNKELFELSYDQNNLNISFDGISFYGLPLHYSYKLEGQDTKWIESEYNHVQYTNLAPGTYHFIVRAGVPFNGWNEPTITTFVIAEPYWQTWWFRTSALFISLFIVFSVFRFRIITIRKKEREKTKIAFELSRLELNALKAQINPHFIFNSITSAMFYLSKNRNTEAVIYLRHFSKLIRKVLENSEKNVVSISEEIDLMRHYIFLESEQFEGNNIDFNVSFFGLDPKKTMIPPTLLQPYIENAIQHGLKNKPGKLLINITFTKKELVKIIIEDNGIGREAAAKLNEGKNHKSLGMLISSRRIKVINGTKQNEFKITDLQDSKGTSRGTRISFFIPNIQSTNKVIAAN